MKNFLLASGAALVFFLLPGFALRAQLKLTPNRVGLLTDAPQFDVDVAGDLFVRSNLGGIVFGYPGNGNQWRTNSVNSGADLLHRFKPAGSTTFFTRMVQFNNGDIAIGADPVNSNARLEILHNSAVGDPQLLLTEQQNDLARLSFENTSFPETRWTIAGYAGNNPAASKMNFWFQDTNGGADRMTILGNGHIGIGNTNPDEELVVGDNKGAGWTFPAITVGNGIGGALMTGSGQYILSMESSSIFNRARIVSDSPAGLGKGGIEIRANAGVAIGDSPGTSDGYMLQIVHNALGLNLERAGQNQNWEFFTSSSGNLEIYQNGSFRGSFNAATGAYSQTSDRRLKQGIKELESVLDRVMALKPARYRYKHSSKSERESVGFIAQEVEALFPEVVDIKKGEREQGTYSINYSGFSPIAIKAIQELKGEMDAKDQQIAELEARLARIEKLLTEGGAAQNVLILEGAAAHPDRAELRQNVPNPFESVTTISYLIPEQTQNAQLRITDASGELLRTLDIEQRGRVQTTVDAAALPAGTYFYSLWVDGALIGTKKMVLSK